MIAHNSHLCQLFLFVLHIMLLFCLMPQLLLHICCIPHALLGSSALQQWCSSRVSSCCLKQCSCGKLNLPARLHFCKAVRLMCRSASWTAGLTPLSLPAWKQQRSWMPAHSWSIVRCVPPCLSLACNNAIAVCSQLLSTHCCKMHTCYQLQNAM